jgi:hypothetical protein
MVVYAEGTIMYHKMTPAAVASRRPIVHTRPRPAARPKRKHMEAFMDKPSIDLNGPIPAVVTPFGAGGRIDEATFAPTWSFASTPA